MIGTENRLLIAGLAFLGAAAIMLFALLRYLNGYMFMAAYDVVLSLVFFAAGIYSYYSKELEMARYAIALVAVSGTVFTTIMNTETGLYWVYVNTVVLFYLLPSLRALLISLATIAIIYILMHQHIVGITLLNFTTTVVLISGFSYLFSTNVERTSEQLRDLSLHDHLTGVENRRAFTSKVDDLVGLYNRFGFSMSLIYLDLDYFKKINDELGHAVGDQVLIEFANTITAKLRQTDQLYRLGGDEFVVLAEGSSQKDAMILAEKLREAVASAKFSVARKLSISLGVAAMRVGDDADSWVLRADQALYRAKALGRNQVAEAR